MLCIVQDTFLPNVILLFGHYHRVKCNHMLLVVKNIIYLSGDYVSTFEVRGKKVLHIEPEALTLLSEQAFIDIAHLLRPAHLQVYSQPL